MKAVALILVLAAAIVAPAQDALREMQKLSWLVGQWKGTATMVLGPNDTKKIEHIEDVQQRLGGLIIVVDGLGVDAADKEKVVHEAYGVISYNTAKKAYEFKPYLATGQSAEAKVSVGDKELTWTIEPAPGIEVRYKVRLTEKGEWHEVGEMTRDKGKTYFKFFETTLTKLEL